MVIAFLGFLGLSLGSFVNALIWRIHEQAEYTNDDGTRRKLTRQDKERLEALSIAKGRSMCTHCGHQLSAKDLVPVLSWVYLRGRCRYCKQPINDTPLAELLLPAVLIASYLLWPFAPTGWGGLEIAIFAVWAGIMTCFVALALYDAKWFLLPDRIVAPLTLLALTFVLLRVVQTGSADHLLFAVLGAMTLSGVFWVLSVVSKGAWIGWGDVKLGVSLGLLAASPLMSLLVIFIASILGTFAALPQIFKGAGLRSSLPFGPHLLLATLVVVFCGNALVDWYFSLLTS